VHGGGHGTASTRPWPGPLAAGAARGAGGGDRLGDLVVDSIAAVTRSSDRSRWLALAFGGVATLIARRVAVRRRVPRFNLAVLSYFAPRAARASTVYGSLGVALVLLVSLFLFGRLAVAAAELNATLWERRAQRRRPKAPPP
jgi:hypothetical protein